MKTVTKTALANARQNRTRNMISGAAIILTTLLIFMVLTVGYASVKVRFAAVNAYYPPYHAMFRQVSEEDAGKLKSHNDMEEVGLRSDLGEGVDDDSTILFLWMDAQALELNKIELAQAGILLVAAVAGGLDLEAVLVVPVVGVPHEGLRGTGEQSVELADTAVLVGDRHEVHGGDSLNHVVDVRARINDGRHVLDVFEGGGPLLEDTRRDVVGNVGRDSKRREEGLGSVSDQGAVVLSVTAVVLVVGRGARHSLDDERLGDLDDLGLLVNLAAGSLEHLPGFLVVDHESDFLEHLFTCSVDVENLGFRKNL